MPSLSLFDRRDPWWGWDGPAARAARRRRRVMSSLAFAASLLAVGGVVAAWATSLGQAGVVGLRAAFGIG
jgi:hypothetical protein